MRNNFVYIFHDQTLITVFGLPRRYQQAAVKFAADGGLDT